MRLCFPVVKPFRINFLTRGALSYNIAAMKNKTPQQLITAIRDITGMTDTEIGYATGISQSTISRLRSGALVDTVSAKWMALECLLQKKIKRRGRSV